MYHIIFFDGSHKEISEEIYEKILAATMTEAVGIEIDRGFYKFTSIQKILSHEDFLYQYPQYIKIDNHQPYSQVEGLGFSGLITKTKRLSALEVMAKGIKKIIDQRKSEGFTSPNAEKILKFSRERYKIAKNA